MIRGQPAQLCRSRYFAERKATLRQRDSQTIKRKFNTVRQLCIGLIMIQIMIHVREERSLRFDFFDHTQRIFDTHMSRMRRPP